MSSVLQHQLKDRLTATDMILSLKEMFEEQRRSARQIAMRTLTNTKIAEGTPVSDNVLKIFDHLNTLEILGGEIDDESKINIILESLLDSFNQFKLNCSTNKIDFILLELLNTLQTAKSIIKSHPSVNNVEKASLSKFLPKEKCN